MLSFLIIAAGLGLLLAGGEALVKGSVRLALRLRISPLVIGLTLVGFGTSMPELVASLNAALAGSPGVAIGNVVGSNIANILLILGLSGLIYPLACARQDMQRDGSFMLLASAAMLVIVLSGSLSRVSGGALLLGLILYTAYSFYAARSVNGQPETSQDAPPPAIGSSLLLVALGIAGVVMGADLLVDEAIALARHAGVSETMIGLTLVAIGTSLPELMTSVMAALRKQTAIALGNVIGSNIFNILGIAGVTALVKPIDVPAQIAQLDIWVMLAASLALVAAAWLQSGVRRGVALLLFISYVIYLAVQIWYIR